MVTARGPRPSYPPGPWSITNVERSFGELLAAFGDLVVARTRGALRSTRPVAPRGRWRDATGRGGAPSTVRSTRSRACRPSGCGGADDARALANMRATLALARRARTDARRPTDRRRRDRRGSSRCPGAGGSLPALRRRRPSRCGSAGRRSIGRRSSAASPPRTTRARAGPCSRRSRRSGGSSTAMAATRSPYRRLLRASAARWAEHGSPIEANAVAARPSGRVARGDAPRDPRRVAVGRRARAGSSRGTTGTSVGAAARRLEPARAGGPAAGAQRRVPGLPRGGSARPRDRVRHPAAARPSAGPGRVHAGDGCLGCGPAGERSLDAAPAVGLRDVRGRRPRQPRSSCSTRAGMRCTWPRSGRVRPISTFPRRAPPILEGTADVLGWDVDEPAWQRRWLGEAAEPREALLEPLRRGHARHLLGALRDRAPPPPRAPSERRLDRGDRRRPRASSRIPSGRGGPSAAS